MGALLCGLVGRVTEKLILVPGLPPGNQGQGDRWETNPDEAEGLCKSAVGTCYLQYCCRKLQLLELRNKNLLAETACARLGSSCCGVSSLLSFRNNIGVTKALLEPLSAGPREQENSVFVFRRWALMSCEGELKHSSKTFLKCGIYTERWR